MFGTLRTLFRKTRIFFTAIRSGVWGIALVAVTWIFLAPPSVSEAAQMSLTAETPTYDDSLRQHRIAKLINMIDSDRIYGLIASRSGSDITADDVRLNIQMAAQGLSIQPADIQVTSPIRTGEGGAKFITVRTN